MRALNASLIKTSTWQDWLYFGIRWILIAVLGFMAFMFRPPESNPINEVLTAVAISAFVNCSLVIFTSVKQLNNLSGYASIVTDWIIAFVFVRVVGMGNDPQQILAILALVSALGLMRQNAIEGFVEVIGVLIVGSLAMVTLNSPEWIEQAVEFYLPTIITLIAMGTLGGIWFYLRDEVHTGVLKEERKHLEAQSVALADMRQRNQALAEMAMELNSTLQYNRILDAALSIGRISMRSDNRHRVMSVIMLYTYDNRLEIASSQGLSHVDESRILPGQAGIIAQALKETRPVFGGIARKDPELRAIISFQNVRSLLCIPLRAGFDNYGVLLYGSEARDAFNSDQVESLRIIGTQATIALQNAVLYQNLMDEKERIIELQENARKDLVRDLHDVPTQTVAAVAMRLGIIPKMMERQPDKVLEEVETIRNMTLRATEEIRHVLFKLRPLILESQGLNAALKQLADKMELTYKQPMKTHVEPIVEQYLDKGQQGAIFHLIEEAANNARKYAEAKLIRASVIVQEDSIVVKITDNGKGFDVKAVAGDYDTLGSFGMVNMRERAELLGGVLDLKSVPGKGTQITAFIPIPSTIPMSRVFDSDTSSHIPRSKLSLAALEKN